MTLIAIDASYWMHKAHNVMPKLKRADGEPVGALLGFSKTLWRFIHHPPEPFTHIVATFDITLGGTWRHKLAPTYKESRKEGTRQTIGQQRERIYDMARAMGVPTLMQECVEADDLLATLARIGTKAGHRVIIVSSDKDLAQCVRDAPPGVAMWDGTRLLDETGVVERYGVEASQIPDYLALIGDTADDIPGVYGIGKGKAATLLHDFADIESIIDNTAILPISGALREAIISQRDQIKLSKQLATVCRYIQFDETLDSFAWEGPNVDRVLEICEENGLVDFAKKVTGL